MREGAKIFAFIPRVEAGLAATQQHHFFVLVGRRELNARLERRGLVESLRIEERVGRHEFLQDIQRTVLTLFVIRPGFAVFGRRIALTTPAS